MSKGQKHSIFENFYNFLWESSCVNVFGALVGGQCVNRVSIDCLIAQGWMLSSSSTGTFTRWRDRSPPKQLLKVNDAQVSDVQIEHGAQAGEVDLRTAMLELAGFKRQVLPTPLRGVLSYLKML